MLLWQIVYVGSQEEEGNPTAAVHAKSTSYGAGLMDAQYPRNSLAGKGLDMVESGQELHTGNHSQSMFWKEPGQTAKSLASASSVAKLRYSASAMGTEHKASCKCHNCARRRPLGQHLLLSGSKSHARGGVGQKQYRSCTIATQCKLKMIG